VFVQNNLIKDTFENLNDRFQNSSIYLKPEKGTPFPVKAIYRDYSPRLIPKSCFYSLVIDLVFVDLYCVRRGSQQSKHSSILGVTKVTKGKTSNNLQLFLHEM